MNYIILSDRAEKQIEDSYNELCRGFDYYGTRSSYIEELLLFDGELQIRNRAENGGNFSLLIGILIVFMPLVSAFIRMKTYILNILPRQLH